MATTPIVSSPHGSSIRLRVVAGLAAVSFVAQAVSHIVRGDAVDLVWMCNIAPLILVVGCLFASPRWVTVAVEWLAYGTPGWLLDLATGGELIPTSFGPHVVCPIAGFVALREVRVKKKSWVTATGLLLALFAVTRLTTPPERNINIAFSVYPAFHRMFSSYPPFFVFTVACFALTFFLVELVLNRLAPQKKDTHDEPYLRAPQAEAARRRG
jgi:hypothetical protein